MNVWFQAAAVLFGMAAGILLCVLIYHLSPFPGALIVVALCVLSIVCSGIGGKK